MQIGFIGLGQMGAPMASQLIRAGHSISVFDKSEDARQLLSSRGATVASSVADAVRDARQIILMLPNSQIVEDVIFADDGVLASMKEDALLIDMGSSHPIETKKIGARLSAAGRRFVDAPVSGGVKRAEAGQLAIMVGGTDADVKDATPILEVMGSTITHTGDLASGHALKALNNLLSASGLIAAAEVLLVGQRFGLDPSTMLDALNQSSGMNNSTKNKLPQFVLTRSFDSGFSLDLQVKDLAIAIDLAQETKTPAPSSEATLDLLRQAQSMLGQGRDHTEAVRLLEQMSGEEISGAAHE